MASMKSTNSRVLTVALLFLLGVTICSGSRNLLGSQQTTGDVYNKLDAQGGGSGSGSATGSGSGTGPGSSGSGSARGSGGGRGQASSGGSSASGSGNGVGSGSGAGKGGNASGSGSAAGGGGGGGSVIPSPQRPVSPIPVGEPIGSGGVPPVVAPIRPPIVAPIRAPIIAPVRARVKEVVVPVLGGVSEVVPLVEDPVNVNGEILAPDVSPAVSPAGDGLAPTSIEF